MLSSDSSMSFRKLLLQSACGLGFLGILYAFQRPFQQFHGVEYNEFVLPQDWQVKGEVAVARLMFPPGPNDGYLGRFDGDWRLGSSLLSQVYSIPILRFSRARARVTC